MKDLIQLELYKFKLKGYFFVIMLFNGISLLYGMGIKSQWSWVAFQGTFDLIQFVGAMWQLLFLIGLPIIFFMYLGASVLGGEKADGQIMLEVTRVADRKLLVKAKALAVAILLLFYFITNLLVSAISYLLFVRGSSFASAEIMIWSKDNISLLASCFFGFVFILFSAWLAMSLSIKFGTVLATILGIAAYAVFTLITRVPGIGPYMLGYLALNSESTFNLFTMAYQLLLSAGLLALIMFWSVRKFRQVDL